MNESSSAVAASRLHTDSALPSSVETAIDTLKHNKQEGGLDNVEVEARLGKYVGGQTFVSGVSARYFREMRNFLLDFYSARGNNARCNFSQETYVDVIYANDVRVTLNERTGKVVRDEGKEVYSGVLIKRKEPGIKNLDFDIENHYSLRVAFSRETVMETKQMKSDAMKYVSYTEKLFTPVSKARCIKEGGRLAIVAGQDINLLKPAEEDEFTKYLSSLNKNGSVTGTVKLPADVANHVQWIFKDFEVASSLDRRIIRYREEVPDVQYQEASSVRIISLAGEFHIPGFGTFAVPTGQYTAVAKISQLSPRSKYKKLKFDNELPDKYLPKSFRRKERTSFHVRNDHAIQTVDMSITRFSEQGLENLDHCRPIYEVEYDYNGRGSNHNDFIEGIQVLLFSREPHQTEYQRKMQMKRSQNDTTLNKNKRKQRNKRIMATTNIKRRR
jgi:hypothetical protein